MDKDKTVPAISLQPLPKSSNIGAIGYDRSTQTLAVKFKHGKGEYRYAGVSAELYDELMNADSPGSFFSANVKNKFEHTLIVPEEAA